MNCKYIASYKHVRIRPLLIRDIELLRNWRNNEEMSHFLKKIDKITPKMQTQWYDKYLTDEDIIQFAIEETENLKRVVGSVAIYGFKGKTAEVGKIVVGDPEAKGKKIGYYALLLAMHIGYEKLGIETFYGDVHEDNMSAKTNDLRAGFQIIGKHPYTEGGYELELELKKNHFYNEHDFLDDFRIENIDDMPIRFEIGQTGVFSKTLTEEDVYNYADICGDYNPLHIDKEKAAQSLFKKQICHGMLTSSLISTVIGTIMPGPGSIYLEQNITFLKPVYFDDTITANVSIVDIIDEKSILVLKTDEYNQEGELVVTGSAKVRV